MHIILAATSTCILGLFRRGTVTSCHTYAERDIQVDFYITNDDIK